MHDPYNIDISGFDIEAADGTIGEVDEVIQEAGESYIVVDAGAWIFGGKMLLPDGIIDRIDPDEEKVYVTPTTYEIKNAPEFDADSYLVPWYRDELKSYYGRLPGGPKEDPDDPGEPSA